MCSSRIYFRHVCTPDDPQHLSQACVAHTVSLLTRTLPEVVWRVRAPAGGLTVHVARRSRRRRAQVELVTEGLPFWEPPSAVQVLAVPAEYTPDKGSQGRARAQQYAAEHSEAAPGDWVVLLGAASVLRERTARACAAGRMLGSHPPLSVAQVDAILAHVVDEAFRLSASRGSSERHAGQYSRIAQARCVSRVCAPTQPLPLTCQAMQGPMCVGRTHGSWLGFLSDTRRAGESHGVFRWQACARALRAPASRDACSVASSICSMNPPRPGPACSRRSCLFQRRCAGIALQWRPHCAHAVLVARSQLEQAVGFDHGPRVRGADFTLFALLCRDQGARFSWLDAPTEEPAPLSITAYVEQRRVAMADRLNILSEGTANSSGGLSVDRRMALLIMTCAHSAAAPIVCRLTRCARNPGSAMCAQLCLVVTALSLLIRHQVSGSELLTSFAISFCSGTMLFCYVLGLASSCSPLSFGGGPPGWTVFCGLMVAQVLWAPAAAFLELAGSMQALYDFAQVGGPRRS